MVKGLWKNIVEDRGHVLMNERVNTLFAAFL